MASFARFSMRYVFAIALCVIPALSISTRGDELKIDLSDGFDGTAINSDMWSLSPTSPARFWIDRKNPRSGNGSLAISAQTIDFATTCSTPCQRNEIREGVSLQLPLGQDVWYGFSFRIEGDYEKNGSARWILAQWKEESGGSPFVAQRFDNGVFHITIQDNECRVLIAKAEGEPDDLAYIIGSVQRQRYSALDMLHFLTEKRLHRCESDETVELGEAPILPNPVEAWVDMAYHIRAGRNGQGLVEVYANGKRVVTVHGSIGHDDVAGPKTYFKIGHYRDLVPGDVTLYVDCFRRGRSLAEVDPTIVCPKP